VFSVHCCLPRRAGFGDGHGTAIPGHHLPLLDRLQLPGPKWLLWRIPAHRQAQGAAVQGTDHRAGEEVALHDRKLVHLHVKKLQKGEHRERQ